MPGRGWIDTGGGGRVRLNDAERADWIDNDEGLYDWWRSSLLSKRDFIRQNRAEIDAAIRNVISGDQPAHYLKYGQVTSWPSL